MAEIGSVDQNTTDDQRMADESRTMDDTSSPDISHSGAPDSQHLPDSDLTNHPLNQINLNDDIAILDNNAENMTDKKYQDETVSDIDTSTCEKTAPGDVDTLKVDYDDQPDDDTANSSNRTAEAVIKELVRADAVDVGSVDIEEVTEPKLGDRCDVDGSEIATDRTAGGDKLTNDEGDNKDDVVTKGGEECRSETEQSKMAADIQASTPAIIRERRSDSDVISEERPPSDVFDGRSSFSTRESTFSEYIPSPLESAVCQFDVNQVKQLLYVPDNDIGDVPDIDIGDVNTDGKNVLHELIFRFLSMDFVEQAEHKNRLIQILGLLVAGGLDMNAPIIDTKSLAKKRSRFTALHVTAKSTYSGDVIRALLSSGVKVNRGNGHQQTALHVAVEQGILGNVEALVDGGADANSTDEYGQTPLHYAVKGRSSSTKIVETLLLVNASVDIKDNCHRTPVHLAAKSGNIKAIRALLEAGGQVNWADGCGLTPVHYASTHDCSGEILKEILHGTADINVQDDVTGESPLHKAVRHHMTENVVTLCSLSVLNPNICDVHGDTPLHVASDIDDWKVWESLMTAGGNIKQENADGGTPLDLLEQRRNRLTPVLKMYAC